MNNKFDCIKVGGATRCMKKGSLFRKQFRTTFFGQWDLKNPSGNIFESVGPNLTKRPRGMRPNMRSKVKNIKNTCDLKPNFFISALRVLRLGSK